MVFASVLSDVWKAEVVDKMNVLVTSCVVVPCSFNYPGTPLPDSRIRGIWHKKDRKENIYHADQIEVADSFKGRTKLLGHLGEKNCTLEIDEVRDHDNGPFCFRAEIPTLGKSSTMKECVAISMMRKYDCGFLSVSMCSVVGITSCSLSRSDHHMLLQW